MRFKTRTSVSGAYAFEAIQAGPYSLSVESPGFRKFSSSGNLVTIGQPATIHVKLEVGAVTEPGQYRSRAAQPGLQLALDADVAHHQRVRRGP